MYSNIIGIIFFIEFIIFFPAIILEITLLLGKGKKSVRKKRNHYIEMGLTINKVILGYIKSKILKLIYYIFYGRYKKLDFKEFKDAIYNFSPEGFEKFTANLYSALGFYAKLMPSGPDGGKDVILIKNFTKTYIECKRYRGDIEVGREICQKLVGAAVGDGVFNGIVFTCGKINANAHAYLEGLQVNHFNLTLVGLTEMYQLYLKAKATNQQLLLYPYHDFREKADLGNVKYKRKMRFKFTNREERNY